MKTRVDLGLRLLIVANFIVVAVLAAAMVGDWLRVEPDDREGRSLAERGRVRDGPGAHPHLCRMRAVPRSGADPPA